MLPHSLTRVIGLRLKCAKITIDGSHERRSLPITCLKKVALFLQGLEKTAQLLRFPKCQCQCA